MDDETSAILAAKLKGDMEDMIRRVMAEVMQDYNFWGSLSTSYAMQQCVFHNAAASPSFVSAVKHAMVTQLTK